MKALTLLALSLLVSCGKYATKDELNDLDNRVNEVENRILELDNKIMNNGRIIERMYTNLQTQINQTFAELEADDEKFNAEKNNVLAMIETLQAQTTELVAKQAALELEDRVIGVFDPCPSVSSNGFKESFFQMSSGKIVAYFEDGGKRFLTVLKTGTAYRTTDSRACTFTI